MIPQPVKEPRYQLYPVVWDEGPSVPFRYLAQVWEQLRDSGRLEEVFYDVPPMTFDTFAAFLYGPGKLPVLVAEGEEPILLAWLGDLKKGSASVHFVYVSEYRRDAGREVFRYWDSWGLYQVYLGVTPETHEKALRVSRTLGFEEIGRIPNLCWIERLQRRVAGVLTHRQGG